MGKLILVRHGQTDLNKKGVYFGILDPPLNFQGKIEVKSARELLKKIDYDEIFTSNLKRAVETAKEINYLDRKLIETEDLREINFGIFEGYTYEELKKLYPEELKKSNDWKKYNYVTGESIEEVQKRVISFIEKTIDFEKNTILVSHWGVINTILSYYFSVGIEGYWKYNVNNGGIVVIEFDKKFPILQGLNIGE